MVGIKSRTFPKQLQLTDLLEVGENLQANIKELGRASAAKRRFGLRIIKKLRGY
jgi:hypothetical protein